MKHIFIYLFLMIHAELFAESGLSRTIGQSFQEAPILTCILVVILAWWMFFRHL